MRPLPVGLRFGPTPIPPLPLDHDCRESWAPVGVARGTDPVADREFTIYQCAVCGLGFTGDVPTEDTAPSLYASRESDDFQAGDSRLVRWLKGFAARRDARSFLRGLELPEAPAILDYGCGNGAFVEAMQQVLPRAHVLGADLHDTAPRAIAPDRYLPVSRLGEWSGRIDLVLCRHVLEHTYHPVEVVGRLRDLLRPGGAVAIEVPALETSVRRLFGRHWSGFYVPYHTLHFTRSSLAQVVGAAGLTVTRHGSAEMPMMGRSIQNRLGCGYGVALFALGVLLQPLQVAIGALTGTSVCLRIWATKERGDATRR